METVTNTTDKPSIHELLANKLTKDANVIKVIEDFRQNPTNSNAFKAFKEHFPYLGEIHNEFNKIDWGEKDTSQLSKFKGDGLIVMFLGIMGMGASSFKSLECLGKTQLKITIIY